MLEPAIRDSLIRSAIEARSRAYCPYSHFAVGAAALTSRGAIYTGCNIENASYGATVCAERAAIYKAVSEGDTNITAISVIGGPDDETIETSVEAVPCGICRQVLREFTSPDSCEIVIARSVTEYRSVTLSRLLPESFGPEKLLM